MLFVSPTWTFAAMWPPFITLRTLSLLCRSAARSRRFATGTSSACMSILWSAGSIALSLDLGSESCALLEVVFPCWTSWMLIIPIVRGSPLRSLGQRLRLVLMLFLVLFLWMSDRVLVVPLWWLISSMTCACVNTFVLYGCGFLLCESCLCLMHGFLCGLLSATMVLGLLQVLCLSRTPPPC